MAESSKQSVCERKRIENISEEDFWSAWSCREPVLQAAVRLGRNGQRKKAYLALADFHRQSLAAEYEFARQEAHQRNNDEKSLRQTLAGADDVMQGRIRGWHSQVIEFGRHIDFNANFGESGQYGFHYLFWLVPLIDRFLLQGQQADLDRVVDIVRQYYDQRTGIQRRIPSLHPVYYELGAWSKTRGLLPAYLAMVNEGAPAAEDVEAFLKLFLGFGRSLLRLQKPGKAMQALPGFGYRAGNWQIVGSATLFRLGVVFPQLHEAARWRQVGTKVMEAHLRQDFFADGGHKERCWGYGWMSLKGVLDWYNAARRTGMLPSDSQRLLRRVASRAFNWFGETLTPTGICPAYGDGDLTEAGEIIAAGKRFAPGKALPAGQRSVCLRSSGYAILRDDGSRDSRYMNINFGPTGGGHTHEDLLDFNAWAFGEPILEEVGRFDSYDHPLDPFFRSPQAHNQVTIDHHPMERGQAQGREVRWYTSAECDVFGAWHDAFRSRKRPDQPVARIHRYILHRRGAYWFVYDVVEPVRETIFSVSSWLHSPRPIRVLSPGIALVTGRVGCVIRFAHPEELKRMETGRDVGASEVTVPRLHPERYFLRTRTWAEKGYRGCLRFAMLIYPFAGRRPEVNLRALRRKDEVPGMREAFEVETPEGQDRIVFDRSAERPLTYTQQRV